MNTNTESNNCRFWVLNKFKIKSHQFQRTGISSNYFNPPQRTAGLHKRTGKEQPVLGPSLDSLVQNIENRGTKYEDRVFDFVSITVVICQKARYFGILFFTTMVTNPKNHPDTRWGVGVVSNTTVSCFGRGPQNRATVNQHPTVHHEG